MGFCNCFAYVYLLGHYGSRGNQHSLRSMPLLCFQQDDASPFKGRRHNCVTSKVSNPCCVAATYAGQGTVPGGTLACSSIALHWGLACLHGLCEPAPPPSTMAELMRHAIAIHSRVRGHTGNSMLILRDIVDEIGTPLNTHCTDIFGVHNAEMSLSVEKGVLVCEDCLIIQFGSVPDLLQPQEAIILTFGAHTTALFCDEHGRYFFFDSTPASVQQVKRNAICTVLLKAHNVAGTFEINGLRLCRCAHVV